MKIAFTTKGKDWDAMIDQRFGRTEFFLVYDEDADKLEAYDNRAIANEMHGAGPRTAQKLFAYKPDILITGNGPGGNAALALKSGNIKVYTGAGDMTARMAYQAYKEDRLTFMQA